jgi:mono/diheme cytochrome c family protein
VGLKRIFQPVKNCGNCHYGMPNETGGPMTCFRYPPVPVQVVYTSHDEVGSDTESRHPEVYEEYFCGEWRERGPE